MAVTGAGATLRQILIALGESVLEMQVAPAGLDVAVHEVAICDPEDASDIRTGDLALVVGVRGRAAVGAVRAAGARGAAAVAVKVDPGQRASALHAAATDAGLALLAVPAEVRWSHLESLVADVLTSARPDSHPDVRTDLFGLAQTLATVTGGHVSIEDTGSRVIAYSSTGDDVDELRRLSVLGRQGPDSYLKLLREWGVYERLRTAETVVRVEARPDLGIRERLTIGIHAGTRVLGSIWLAEGSERLGDRAERALLGAARVAATHLAQRRREPEAGLRLRENLLAGLLDGRMDAESVAAQIGMDDAAHAGAATVVAFRLPETSRSDRSQRELLFADMINLISVHAAAFRRTALVTSLDGRIYVLLPELGSPERSRGAVLSFATEVTTAIARDLGAGVLAGIGSTVSAVTDVPGCRAEADRVLDVLAERGGAAVAAIEDVRSEALVAETLALLRAHPGIRDPRVTVLLAHDARHGGELAASVRCYLDALGDVRTAARVLGVHPNTVRYRVRRAAEISGLDLADAAQRLFVQLQLRLG